MRDFKSFVDLLVALFRGYMQLIYLAAAIGAGIIIVQDVFFADASSERVQEP